MSKPKIQVLKHDMSTQWRGQPWGQSSSLLKPVPGNVAPARVWLWPSFEAAKDELEAMGWEVMP